MFYSLPKKIENDRNIISILVASSGIFSHLIDSCIHFSTMRPNEKRQVFIYSLHVIPSLYHPRSLLHTHTHILFLSTHTNNISIFSFLLDSLTQAHTHTLTLCIPLFLLRTLFHTIYQLKFKFK